MRKNAQAGFSLLGMLVAVMIVGIMASLAVPRFVSTMTTANTAKIQSDLTTLDAAIAVYQLENGKSPGKISDLGEYVSDIGKLKPPAGKCTLTDGTVVDVKGKTYEIKSVTEDGAMTANTRAVCDGHTAGDFGYGGEKKEKQEQKP